MCWHIQQECTACMVPEKVTGVGSSERELCGCPAGYGKVFKARWKSTMVAVKVVEHSHIPKSNSNSPNPGVDRSDPAGAEARIAREMLLSTSISHPNVIATYKICTICVGSVLDSGFPGSNEVSEPLSDCRQCDWCMSQHKRHCCWARSTYSPCGSAFFAHYRGARACKLFPRVNLCSC